MDAKTIGRAASTAAATAALALAAGCTGSGHVEDADLLVGWSQASDEWVAEVMPIPATLVATEAELAAWLATMPDAVGDSEELSEADLDEVFLVIGGYHRCREVSAVDVDGGSGEVTFVVFVPEGDEQVACAWSPYQIDVWAVPVQALGGHEPVLVDGG